MITKKAVFEEKSTKGIALTFAFFAGGMFKESDEQKMARSAARQCCKRGGMPGTCTCCEEILNSDSWLDWPESILEFFTTLVARYRRMVAYIEKKKQKLLNTQLHHQAI